MSELVVADYHDPLRALYVLDALRHGQAEWNADLDDAIVFFKRADGRAQLLASSSAGRRNDGEDLLITLLDTLFLPVADPKKLAGRQNSNGALRESGKVANAAWWQNQLGLDDEFIQRVRKIIRPGDSALLMLIRWSDLDEIIDEIPCYGGRVLQAPVAIYEEVLVKDSLGARHSA